MISVLDLTTFQKYFFHFSFPLKIAARNNYKNFRSRILVCVSLALTTNRLLSMMSKKSPFAGWPSNAWQKESSHTNQTCGRLAFSCLNYFRLVRCLTMTYQLHPWVNSLHKAGDLPNQPTPVMKCMFCPVLR
jgi:hypothetical protein